MNLHADGQGDPSVAVTPHACDTMLLTPGDDQAADFDGPRADARRLAVARATGLLGPEPDPELDRYGQLARRVLNVAACYISITDDTHVFVKSAVECAAASTPPLLEPAKSHISCAYVAVIGKPLAVADLREDPRFRQHALDATPHLPAYLGVPLFVRGQSIGAICALDDKVRQWLPSEVELLGELASAVGKLIEVTSSAALSRLALVDTQVRYRSLTDDAPLVAFQALDDGSVVYVNRYTEEYLGQPRERLCSLGWLDFVPADGRAQALRQWQDMVATEKAGGFELPIRCADGVYRTLHVRAQPVRDHANRHRTLGRHRARRRGAQAGRSPVPHQPGSLLARARSGEARLLGLERRHQRRHLRRSLGADHRLRTARDRTQARHLAQARASEGHAERARRAQCAPRR